MKNRLVANDIYECLKAEIRSGVLPSDTPLREVELAERFGVSRTPIREVLHRLSSERIVRTVPNVGSFVGAFTWEDAREIFAIRQVLESFAAGLTAKYVTDEIIRVLENLLQRMRKAVAEQDAETYAAADEEFHAVLNANCGNKNLIHTIENLNDPTKIANLRRNQYRIEGRMQESLSDHVEIVDAIKHHELKKVSNLLMSHGQNIFSDVTQLNLLTEFF